MSLSDGFVSLGTITNPYGASAPAGVTYASGKHTGVDVVLKNTTVSSLTNGIVDSTGYDASGWGNYVWVKNINDGLYTLYAHLKTSPYVSKGQVVTAGSTLGIEGSTGQSTGKHLHVEVRKDKTNAKTAIDPVTYFNNSNTTSGITNGRALAVTQAKNEADAQDGSSATLASKIGDTIIEFWDKYNMTSKFTRVALVLVAIGLIFVVFKNGILGGGNS